MYYSTDAVGKTYTNIQNWVPVSSYTGEMESINYIKYDFGNYVLKPGKQIEILSTFIVPIGIVVNQTKPQEALGTHTITGAWTNSAGV